MENCGLRVRQECREHFSHHRLQRKPLVSDPSMHHGTCVYARAVMHAGIANLRWWGKRSRHSRRLRNPQFYVSGKRPMIPMCTVSNVLWMPVPCGHIWYHNLNEGGYNFICRSKDFIGNAGHNFLDEHIWLAVIDEGVEYRNNFRQSHLMNMP